MSCAPTLRVPLQCLKSDHITPIEKSAMQFSNHGSSILDLSILKGPNIGSNRTVRPSLIVTHDRFHGFNTTK